MSCRHTRSYRRTEHRDGDACAGMPMYRHPEARIRTAMLLVATAAWPGWTCLWYHVTGCMGSVDISFDEPGGIENTRLMERFVACLLELCTACIPV